MQQSRCLEKINAQSEQNGESLRVGVGICVFSSSSHGQMLTTVIHVTTTDDTVLPGDGETSLREAILQAHQESDPDVRIELQSGARYDIDRATNLFIGSDFTFTEGTPLDPAYGDFDIRRDLVIQGNGSTIDANDLGRVFEITGGVDVTFRDVTIRDGRTAFAADDTRFEGGGIRADNAGGRVRFFDSRIVSNEVVGSTSNGVGNDVRGGGIFVAGGELVINNTVVEFNDARGGDGESDTESNDVNDGGDGGDARGGAIYAEDATVRIRNNSVIRENDAIGGAGGTGDDTGGRGGAAQGGGIFQENDLLEIDTSIVELNNAYGGSGGRGKSDVGGSGRRGPRRPQSTSQETQISLPAAEKPLSASTALRLPLPTADSETTLPRAAVAAKART